MPSDPAKNARTEAVPWALANSVLGGATDPLWSHVEARRAGFLPTRHPRRSLPPKVSHAPEKNSRDLDRTATPPAIRGLVPLRPPLLATRHACTVPHPAPACAPLKH